VTVTLTFDSPEAAAAWMAGKGEAKPSTKTAADTPRSAATAPAAAPAPTAAPTPAATPASPTPSLTFKGDVVPAMLAYSKKVPRETFAALMAKLGVAKVPELEAKPETWAGIIKTCNA
jgi:hypothetical protein